MRQCKFSNFFVVSDMSYVYFRQLPVRVAVCIIPNPTHSVVRRRLTGTGRFDLIAPARGGSLGSGSEFRAALVALCRRVSAPAHSRIVPLGNLRKLRPPCAPQPPTQVLRLPGESLEHSSDRHPAAVFKHSEPRRAPYRHDPPLTPSRPQPKPPPHNARQRNIGHPHRR